MVRFAVSYLERIGREWQQAYAAANGKTAPAIIWEAGWFRIEGTNRKYRRKEIEKARDNLRRQCAKTIG